MPCLPRTAPSFVARDPAEELRARGVTAEVTFAHQCADRARDSLAQNARRDFLLVVSFDEPHHPYICPPSYVEQFSVFDYPLTASASDPMTGKPSHQREWAEAMPVPWGQRSLRFPTHFGCNAFVDSEIGRVLEAVDLHAPNALVIYTSDHGETLLSHGLYAKGPAMYEETTHIPFLARWPGHISPGAVNPHPISHIDLTPTILDVFGLDCPPFLEGRSLGAAFCDSTARAGETVFLQFHRFDWDLDGYGGFQPIRCAYDGRYKLAINLLSSDELYDLEADPEELHNLIASGPHAEIRDRLHASLLKWMNRTRDPFRGPVWERRPWQEVRTLGWKGPLRVRPEDGYERPVLSYSTGLEPDA